eukprot:CAMPEP_0197028260 /NCGR_PEP_ID=MMETSP1384-20130603/7984_1 /TAXON_ID=29189 /ORGANISM="Ammonia sp." /LENGTH=649 /DNA_ID=CAMNT_0042457231 /DNA_START=84 /DNA_END=2033 /DNA_ORIENTATION=+
MTELCKADGSIQKLVANQWKTVGIGQVIIIRNNHNPSYFLLKLLRNKRNEVYVFQCKPKAKASGKSLIMKGIDTKTKKEYVLAVRFDQLNSLEKFKTIIARQLVRIQNNSISNNKKRTSMPPKELQEQLSQYAWDCAICHYRNKPKSFDCEVCNTPRPLNADDSSNNLMASKPEHIVSPSNLPDDLPPVFTPVDSAPYNGYANASSSPRGISEIPENEALSPANSKGDDEKKVDEVSEEKSSIKELIEKVTNGEEISSLKHTIVQDVLLLQHDTFTDAETMLSILLDRISDVHLGDMNARIRGVKMVESWIQKYFDVDFQRNEVMLDKIQTFLEQLENNKFVDLSDADFKLLMRIKSAFASASAEWEIEQKKKKMIHARKQWTRPDIPKDYDPMAATAEAIAEQLTLMDFELFKSIPQREMCGQAWKKKDKEQRAPNLLQMIHQFNMISKWVQCVVLQQRNRKKRSRTMEKFIHIALKLQELRNFSACCAINFGLSANVVYRLQDAWKGVSNKEMKQYGEIQTIFKGKKNWELLRVLHKNAHAPSILHTGLFLQDLLNTDEGNEDTRKDGTVNFLKLKQTYTLIEQICMYQGEQYDIKQDLVMQTYLRETWDRQKSYNDDKMYKISQIVKAKDAENKEIEESDLILMAW